MEVCSRIHCFISVLVLIFSYITQQEDSEAFSQIKLYGRKKKPSPKWKQKLSYFYDNWLDSRLLLGYFISGNTLRTCSKGLPLSEITLLTSIHCCIKTWKGFQNWRYWRHMYEESWKCVNADLKCTLVCLTLHNLPLNPARGLFSSLFDSVSM